MEVAGPLGTPLGLAPPEEEENTTAPETQAEEAPQPEVDELTKWREMALRTAAEYDNYRKRCVKDREDFTKYANRSLLEELLPVIDNFEMGMQMAHPQIVNFLKREGILRS